MALGVLVANGCAGAEGETEQRGDVNQDGVYRYVLDHNPDLDAPIFGGAHEIVVPVERGKEDAIDAPNQPSRLHPKLGETTYQTYDATLSQGESDWEVFPSNWWAQSENGIAKRWTGGSSDLSTHADLDNLAPVEKYDLLFNAGATAAVPEVEHWTMEQLRKPVSERGDKHSHPAVTALGPATKWELQNHGLYQTYAHPDNWWGHCNGWASYATAEPGSYPKRDIRVKLVDGKVTECVGSLAGAEGCVLVRMGDIEALMSELYFSDKATFSGRRCNTAPDEVERDEFGRPTDPACRDLNAGSFHIGVTGLLGRGANFLFEGAGDKQFPAFVIDHNYDWEVWNFPLVRYQLDEQAEITEEQANQLVGAAGSDYQFNPAATKFVRVRMRYWMISDGVSDSQMLERADQRSVSPHETELNYVLEMNSADKILGGEWIERPEVSWGEDSKKLHPDFFWMATDPVGYGEASDDTGGNNDNPFVKYPAVKALLSCANAPSSCAPADVEPEPEPEPTPSGPSCEGSCGASVSAGGATCWCDEQCSTYNDCCGDYAAVCTSSDPEPEPEPTPAASCEGHCGASGAVPGSSPGCYCDSACEGYGDCCGDYATTCS